MLQFPSPSKKIPPRKMSDSPPTPYRYLENPENQTKFLPFALIYKSSLIKKQRNKQTKEQADISQF